VDDVHEVREVQRTINASGPTAIAAKEFSRPTVPQQPLHWIFEIHGYTIPEMRKNPNGVNS
jgi:hypothetical protein